MVLLSFELIGKKDFCEEFECVVSYVIFKGMGSSEFSYKGYRCAYTKELVLRGSNGYDTRVMGTALNEIINKELDK